MTTAGIKQVASRAGVSVGTVSNVLNRPHLVADGTRDRVFAAITALGFVRNESARSLRSGRSRTIAMVVLDVSNPFFTDVARGAESVAEEGGALVVMCNSGQDTSREQRHLELLAEQRVMGLLITPVDSTAEPLLDRLVDGGTHVVLVDRSAGSRNRCSVTVDDVLGGRLAGDHLVDAGHRRVAFVGGPLSIQQVCDRHEGLRQSLSAAGAPPPLLLESADLTVAAGRQAAASVLGLSRRRRPTAVFCANDLVALGVLQEATRRRLRIPDDLAIVGYDDIDYAAAAAVPLSSVRQPREELGRTAARLLLDETGDGAAHRHRQVVFNPDLIVRESSLANVTQ